jgi:alkylation response protein AidB-like acyl-CoA dehydrogenase
MPMAVMAGQPELEAAVLGLVFGAHALAVAEAEDAVGGEEHDGDEDDAGDPEGDEDRRVDVAPVRGDRRPPPRAEHVEQDRPDDHEHQNEGNDQIARPDQQDRWLRPIADGTLRSAFAMTEPAPGGGSDPAMIRTTATRHGDSWRVHGRKWFITGAGIARHFVLIARTSDDPRRGLSAFLFDASAPGWRIERRIPIMGPEEHGGHCEMVFDGLEIPDADRLLGIGDGLKVTQIRLGPARLTHCMRWLGLAKRCLEIAGGYIATREGFGIRLADRESVQGMMGAAALAIQQGRLLTMHAAWLLDQGDRARAEVSMAKVVVSETLHLAADTAIQLCGARGYSRDTVLEWIYRYARQARLVDGASEVHRMVLAAPRPGRRLCRRRESRRARGPEHRGGGARLPAPAHPGGVRDRRAAAGPRRAVRRFALGGALGVPVPALARDDARPAQGLSRARLPPRLRHGHPRERPAAKAARRPLGPHRRHHGHAGAGLPLVFRGLRASRLRAQHPELRRHQADPGEPLRPHRGRRAETRALDRGHAPARPQGRLTPPQAGPGAAATVAGTGARLPDAEACTA